ncbi:MAG: YbhB/YbcL family Raf kinase inhibitor-like protein [Oligoflexus sp.]
MEFWSNSFQNGKRIPEAYAFGKSHPTQMITLANNVSPHFAWKDLPKDTRSLALVCIDPDAPSKPDNVNKEGCVVAKDLPRVDFCHLLLVDIDPSLQEIPEGLLSRGVTAHGKPQELPQIKGRQGLNDYTSWFEGDADMQGQYFGYDGPCPPWNDMLLHHYHFKLLALDCLQLDLPAVFSYPEAVKAMQNHILEEKQWTGTYSTNPAVKE